MSLPLYHGLFFSSSITYTSPSSYVNILLVTSSGYTIFSLSPSAFSIILFGLGLSVSFSSLSNGFFACHSTFSFGFIYNLIFLFFDFYIPNFFRRYFFIFTPHFFLLVSFYCILHFSFSNLLFSNFKPQISLDHFSFHFF